KYINGKYWEAGPIPRSGSFTLKCVDQNSFGCQKLAGWYYPKDDPVGSGWPWVLTRTNFNAPEQDPNSLQCLYRNNATDVPEVNGQWEGLLGGITICNNREGILTFSQGGSDAYVSGKSKDHKHIIIGRYYQGEFPADDKVKKDQFCDGIDGVNIMLKVFSLPDQSFNLGGFISSDNIFNPQNAYKVVYANLSEDDDDDCASENFADRLAECETGEVGGPIFNPFRASAASMAVSVAAVVFVVVATLF
ncbi:MAG: hypothetical protein Q8P67_23250, partial [archaeon]|nr:hypothetical protein [archaeon]